LRRESLLLMFFHTLGFMKRTKPKMNLGRAIKNQVKKWSKREIKFRKLFFHKKTT